MIECKIGYICVFLMRNDDHFAISFLCKLLKTMLQFCDILTFIFKAKSSFALYIYRYFYWKYEKCNHFLLICQILCRNEKCVSFSKSLPFFYRNMKMINVHFICTFLFTKTKQSKNFYMFVSFYCEMSQWRTFIFTFLF